MSGLFRGLARSVNWRLKEETIVVSLKTGGEGGIRTHGTLARTTVFETAPFDRSGTSPQSPAKRRAGWLTGGGVLLQPTATAAVGRGFAARTIAQVPQPRKQGMAGLLVRCRFGPRSSVKDLWPDGYGREPPAGKPLRPATATRRCSPSPTAGESI